MGMRVSVLIGFICCTLSIPLATASVSPPTVSPKEKLVFHSFERSSSTDCSRARSPAGNGAHDAAPNTSARGRTLLFIATETLRNARLSHSARGSHSALRLGICS